MKIVLFCGLLVALANGYSLENDKAKFQHFKIKHGKTYTTEEDSRRFATFKETLRSIEEHNALYEQGLVSWKKGITKFADMTNEDYQQMLTLQTFGKPNVPKSEHHQFSSKLQAPEALDWRDKSAVTPVQDMGNCASSWAFAVSGSVESAYFIKTGDLVPLSSQQLVDCTSDYGNDGCTSGYLRETMPYIEFKGLQTDESYPYKAEEGECKYNASAIVTKVHSWVNFHDNQYQLLQAVANYGPVAASLDASDAKDYTGGVFSSSTCSSYLPTLAVLVVGYGSENGTDFWIAKASRGTSWGEEGYIKIQRMPNTQACGLYKQPVYPLLD